MEEKDEAKVLKKGLWAILKESMNKASSGCGPGCGCHVENNTEKRREDGTTKPADDKDQA